MNNIEKENVKVSQGKLYQVQDDVDRVEAALPSFCIQNHASNIMPLPNGDLLCVWFSGTQEGIADISIYMSRLNKGESEWTTPVKLSEDPTRSEQNPILFLAPNGDLWLIYTAQKSGNQDTAIVRYRVSSDNGYTWGPIETLFDKPGTFVRQPVVVLDNSEWLIPIFYCRTPKGIKWTGDYDVSAVKISSDNGKTWTEYEVPNSLGCVHMNVEKLNDGTLLALFRSRWADNIYMSVSKDNGRTWTEPVPTELPNNNSSIQFTVLDNGHLALVYNHINAEKATERRASLYDEIEDEEDATVSEVSEEENSFVPEEEANRKTAFWGTPRAPLTIAISEDGGKTWPYKRNIEVGDGYCMSNNSKEKINREFSYPSVKQTQDGKIHVTFTYFRQYIKYVCVSEEWVKAGTK
ncbi:exo-alpha-sialidase [Clostridium sp. SYSU_GA19001]|uniref:sialidase family protein n=1 Tax=Clostridium caldaquaticum TaxID=2940653 RepID=UPI0020774D46|nr:sialidase family protein [Clostridium caldaquaticum]MCM8711691.1 exo-alpha-sialidase [Clostridium caldaquaticum]